jgi:DnaJ homolog subfamily A member 2
MMHGKVQGGQQQPKMQPTKRELEVPLEKLYTGGTVNLPHERARVCDVCEGRGGTDVKKCPECKGEGAVVKMVQVGPGMYAQAEENCKPCNGMGDIFGEGGKCETCEGRRIVKKAVELDVPVPPGAPAGHVITLEGEGN